jgi:hypothetical protein
MGVWQLCCQNSQQQSLVGFWSVRVVAELVLMLYDAAGFGMGF